MKTMKFRTKKAAEQAVEECQTQGWAAGIMGSGPWYVQATGYTDGRRLRITYDLGTDGHFHEYSRKEMAA
jgi:hypothetical protein